MKSGFKYSIYQVGWDPKNGIYGLVDNPPKNNPAVIKTSGMTSTIESHKTKTCNPQFSIYSNYS